MLEGKEFEKQLGQYGSASVDLKPSGELEVAVALKVDLIGELEKLAAKTDQKLDDKVVAYIKGLLAAAAAVPKA